MKIKAWTISVIFLFIFAPMLKAQAVKNEVEDSIKREEMPGNALKTLDEFWQG